MINPYSTQTPEQVRLEGVENTYEMLVKDLQTIEALLVAASNLAKFYENITVGNIADFFDHLNSARDEISNAIHHIPEPR